MVLWFAIYPMLLSSPYLSLILNINVLVFVTLMSFSFFSAYHLGFPQKQSQLLLSAVELSSILKRLFNLR
jgi:hypothetical protein